MSRRSNRRGSSNNISKSIFAILVALIITSIVYFVFKYEEPIERDLITGCPIDRSLVARQYVFLLDTTEPLVPSQYQEISFRIEQIIQNLKTNDLIKFYSVESNDISGVNRLSIKSIGDQSVDYYCIPDSKNWMDSPQKQQQTALIPKFLTTQALDSIDNKSVQNSSPIIDAIRYIQADDERFVTSQDIYIISDMIENSTILSMYRPSWYENEYLPNQNNVLNQKPLFRRDAQHNINIMAIMRPQHPNVQNEEWINFWTHIIKGTNPNATPHINLRFDRISGGL
jgi:hypothetical protein